jgi:hypothetical protein
VQLSALISLELLKNLTLRQNWASLGAALMISEGDSPKLILPEHMTI